MIIKAIPLLILALVIDALQFLMSLGLSILFAAPGTVLGAAAGASAGSYVCGGLGGGAAAACAAIGGAVAGYLGSFANVPLATASEPLAIGLGFAVSISLSFTLGTMLVVFLQLAGMLDKKSAMLTYIGEVLPGVDMLPAWTALVVWCVIKQAKKKVLTGVIGAGASLAQNFILPNTLVGNAMRSATAEDMGFMGINYQEMQSEVGEALEESANARRTMPMQDIRLPQNTRATIKPEGITPPYVKAA